MRRYLVPAVAVALVAGLIAYEALSSGNGNTGQPAPPLPPAVLQPPKETLASLRGKPALVNFWASWCEPCHEEAPQLTKLQGTLGDSGTLVGVDYTDKQSGARDFIKKYGYTFPILEDPDGVYGARFHFSALPTTVVLDARGRIVETLRGPQTAAELRRALKEAARE
ncbi:MAG TPA: TlpA disulfide reductase family protein [Solirubrobacterales bacterium]|nr:TlpA disulfide reductase family protein [Solirubrobacterales bacterium]